LRGFFVKIPVERATTPRDGHALTDRYWMMHDGHLIFYVDRKTQPHSMDVLPIHPQCNPSKSTAEHLLKSMKLGNTQTTIGHVPVVFESSCRNYVYKAWKEDRIKEIVFDEADNG
jgi:hypothetical protein